MTATGRARGQGDVIDRMLASRHPRLWFGLWVLWKLALIALGLSITYLFWPRHGW